TINRHAEHSRLRLNSADAPADDAEAVDHRRVRIGPDERIRVENFAIVDLRVLNTFGQILEVHLVNDADARRNELKRFERLLAPLLKLVTFAVALECH